MRIAMWMVVAVVLVCGCGWGDAMWGTSYDSLPVLDVQLALDVTYRVSTEGNVVATVRVQPGSHPLLWRHVGVLPRAPGVPESGSFG
jgi:hypothetical protein